ncbi:MAG: CBS domain-containing protein, partial [Desulfobacterales bacterium]
PMVWISELLTRFISKGKAVHIFSREELLAMAGIGVETGQLHRKESRIIHNLLRFEGLKVTDIMTPRTVISALPEAMPVSEALRRVTRMPFSRIPVYDGQIDNITGFVIKDDVLVFSSQKGDNQLLKALRREISMVPESVSLPVLLERFLKERHHIAVVVNEHGGIDGLVTLEDLIETLMGMEIMDETDLAEDMRALARNRWLERIRVMGLDGEVLGGSGPDELAMPRVEKPGSSERQGPGS